MLVAIQPDNYGLNDASSPLWGRLLLEAGHEVRVVDVHRADILKQLNGCDGFMWRHGHLPQMRQIARRLLPVLEKELGLVVYPDQNTCWHYDDKIAQSYLFSAADISTPKTWVWFEKEEAQVWVEQADFPVVLKLWSGASSSNVVLVRSRAEARLWIQRLFGRGVFELYPRRFSLRQRVFDMARIFARGETALPWEVHRGYVYFQEFLPDNAFDTRVTVIGNRAFGFRRFNRENDFRASGSGKIDYDPQLIAPEFLRLAFDVAGKLKTQSCALDCLWRDGVPVVGEISYAYASWAIHACPGYWDSGLVWHPGQMWPEEAQIEDFLVRLNARTL